MESWTRLISCVVAHYKMLLCCSIANYVQFIAILCLECPETVTALYGSPGILVEGVVQPPVPNVTVVVDLGEDGQVITYTDSSGQYR